MKGGGWAGGRLRRYGKVGGEAMEDRMFSRPEVALGRLRLDNEQSMLKSYFNSGMPRRRRQW